MKQSSAGQIGGNLTLLRIGLLIFVGSYFIYAISPQGRPSFSDLTQGAEIPRVALTVVQEGSFAHPFYSLPTGPTAHTAPAYVLLYALVAKVFGIGWTGAGVLWALNVGFLALQLGLLPVLSDRLGLGVVPGVVAAVLGVIVQPYRVLVEWESLFMGAILVALCVMTLSYFKTPGDWRRSLLFGLLWGVAILANPECVLLLIVWAHIAAMENSTEILSRARRAMAVVVAGAALACLPWFIRNFQQFHAVFFVRDNFGLELFTSNNPCAQPTMLENLTSGCHGLTHPNANSELAVEVVEKGEVPFNREMLHRALSWISSNPRAFAWLTARRILRFWFPYLGSFRYSIPMGLLTILSLSGLAGIYREHRRAAWLLASTLLVYPFVHYLVQFEARYRYPIFWATFLPAACAIMKIVRWTRKASAAKASAGEEKHEMIVV